MKHKTLTIYINYGTIYAPLTTGQFPDDGYVFVCLFVCLFVWRDNRRGRDLCLVKYHKYAFLTDENTFTIISIQVDVCFVRNCHIKIKYLEL